MTCCNKEPIIIYQGFGTKWDNNDLLKVSFDSEIDINGFGAEFIIGDIVKSYTDIENGFSVNLTASETATLATGPICGTLVLIDLENNKRPFSTELPFLVKDWAGGDIKLDGFSITINASVQNNKLDIDIDTINPLEINEETIRSYISLHNQSEEAHPYIRGLISDEIIARENADSGLLDKINANTTKFNDYRTAEAQDIIDNTLETKSHANSTFATKIELENGLDTKQDTISAGAGITITNNNVVENAGVRDISTGVTNGTISMNKNGVRSEVSVAGLGSAAFTPVSDYATAAQGIKADGAVRFNLAQSLTNTQKTQARSNIDAALVSDLEAEVETREYQFNLLDRAITNEIDTRENQVAALTGAISTEIANRKAADGTLTNLTTDAKTNLVSAINEVDSHADTNASNIGTLSNLTTEAKGNLVSAINEVDSHADTNASNIGTLSNLTTDSKTNLVAAINEVDSHADINASNISDIQGLIPQEATTSNQLADKEFVNSSIATNTANFIGTFDSVSALNSYSGTITNNDYAFVINGVVKDNGNDWATFSDLDAYNKSLLTNFDYAWVINGSKFDLYRFDIVEQDWVLRVSDTTKEAITLNTAYNRYKATVSGNVVTWYFEYTLNNSSFTAAQWTAINSGATPALIDQITTNKNNISTNATAISNEAGDRERADTVQQNAIIANYNAIVSNTNDIGTLSTLTTTAKTNLVSAINELNSGKVNANTAIGAGTKCKITYDSKGLVTAGADLEATDIPSLTLSKISDVTATASELNVLDGITATTTELNYVDGVTSSIQTQLNSKVPDARTINNKALSSDITLGASDVGALSDSTKYGADLSYSSNTLQLLDQDGSALGNSVTIQSSPDIDEKSITLNSGDELQTVGVIDQRDNTTAIKTWTGTKQQYDAITTKDSNTVYNITDDTTPSNFANVNLSNLSQTGQAIIDSKANISLSNLNSAGQALFTAKLDADKIQFVNALPANPVSGTLYLIPE